jgi:hypothetical protein
MGMTVGIQVAARQAEPANTTDNDDDEPEQVRFSLLGGKNCSNVGVTTAIRPMNNARLRSRDGGNATPTTITHSDSASGSMRTICTPSQYTGIVLVVLHRASFGYSHPTIGRD